MQVRSHPNCRVLYSYKVTIGLALKLHPVEKNAAMATSRAHYQSSSTAIRLLFIIVVIVVRPGASRAATLNFTKSVHSLMPSRSGRVLEG